ncbi:MAG: hypothetical protein H0U62_05815 [Actinobacteria bacterium]|nr:hypothetical protein [Actinomycetota bacterium]
MPSWWEGPSFWLVVFSLTIVAMGRGQGTYWLARLTPEQALRHAHPVTGWRGTIHAWLQDDGLARGRQALQRWGLAMVPLCYLTVGFQTLVLAAAGVMRIRWSLFTLVQLPGAIAWALIYATIGFAAWQAILAAGAGSPWTLVALVIAVLALVVAAGARRHLGRRAKPAAADIIG